jgi:type VI secretion system protein ImpE
MQALELLKAGDLAGARAALQDAVRKDPSNSKLRVFLFQLSCVLGEWGRAVAQLKVCAEMDPTTEPMARAYREAIICEVFRAKVFAGDKEPLLFGKPDRWVALMIEANKVLATGEAGKAAELRAEAFEAAPTTSGAIGDERFEWIADADMRFGPMLEIIVNGKYYWAPFSSFAKIEFEPPVDLRDRVWTASRLTWANGGEVVGFVPTRYPGAETEEDDALRLARSTDWRDAGADTFTGRGQRLLATDAGETALMDIRQIDFDVEIAEGADAEAGADAGADADAGVGGAEDG